MDKQFLEVMDNNTPKFNPLIANGLAVEQMKYVEQYIDNIFHCAAESFPEGLKYIDLQRCTPKEEYDQLTLKTTARRTFELSDSTVFLVKARFKWRDKELHPRYFYLPYVTEAGLIKIRGSVFSISPVLADKAISVGVNNLFVPLNRDKLTFERLQYNFLIDGPSENNPEVRQGKRQSTFVAWSKIYHVDTSGGDRSWIPPVKAVSTLPHYLFAKYGLTRVFSQFGNTDIRVGYEDTINAVTCSDDEWVICYSIHSVDGFKPKGVRDKAYTPSTIRLAIRRSSYNSLTESLIGGFFYVLDHWPERFLPEYVDEVRLWRALLGHAIFQSPDNEGKLVSQIETHLGSLDLYLDPMAKKDFRDEGIFCNDLYEFFVHIIETMPERVRHSGSQIASMYDKRLTVLRYVLLDLVKAIFGFTFKLRSITKKELTERDILNAMTKSLKRDKIMSINNGHGEVSSISCPGDNMIFKITSNVVLQTQSTGGGRSKSNLDDPSKLLHASIAEVGSYSNLPKSDPTGRSRLNPCLALGADGSILRDPEKAALIDEVQQMIEGVKR